jgi:hypothetical protein
MARIVISSGHGKYIRGAEGPEPWGLDEVDEARKIVDRVAAILRGAGVDIVTYHDDVSTTQNENLTRLVDFHNAQTRDLDISVHLNAWETTSGPMGCEVLYVTQADLAEEVSAAIADAGDFLDRGPKKRTDLFFLNNTEAPAILIETCFVDSQADAALYRQNFDVICNAIAAALVGEELEPPEPQPEPPDLPEPEPPSDKPVLGLGDDGPYVRELQTDLNRENEADLTVDGDFGSKTDSAVRRYQASRGLEVDGIVGAQTWNALDSHEPPLPPPPGALTQKQQTVIMKMAMESDIAGYSWRDRGVGPDGWIMGLSLAFAQSYLKLKQGHPAVQRIARANTHDDDDVCMVYREEFDDLGMSNEIGGPDVLRHIYAFLIGMAMRESSGAHCVGRDQSADNYDEMTVEAGMFQQSYNSFSCDQTLDPLMDEYADGLSPGYLEAFAIGVSCSSADWQNFGDPNSRGYEFQALAKITPAFSAEACAVGLRVLKDHWGPVKRKEVELRRDADDLLKAVQLYVDSIELVA